MAESKAGRKPGVNAVLAALRGDEEGRLILSEIAIWQLRTIAAVEYAAVFDLDIETAIQRLGRLQNLALIVKAPESRATLLGATPYTYRRPTARARTVGRPLHEGHVRVYAVTPLGAELVNAMLARHRPLRGHTDRNPVYATGWDAMLVTFAHQLGLASWSAFRVDDESPVRPVAGWPPAAWARPTFSGDLRGTTYWIYTPGKDLGHGRAEILRAAAALALERDQADAAPLVVIVAFPTGGVRRAFQRPWEVAYAKLARPRFALYFGQLAAGKPVAGAGRRAPGICDLPPGPDLGRSVLAACERADHERLRAAWLQKEAPRAAQRATPPGTGPSNASSGRAEGEEVPTLGSHPAVPVPEIARARVSPPTSDPARPGAQSWSRDSSSHAATGTNRPAPPATTYATTRIGPLLSRRWWWPVTDPWALLVPRRRRGALIGFQRVRDERRRARRLALMLFLVALMIVLLLVRGR